MSSNRAWRKIKINDLQRLHQKRVQKIKIGKLRCLGHVRIPRNRYRRKLFYGKSWQKKSWQAKEVLETDRRL